MRWSLRRCLIAQQTLAPQNRSQQLADARAFAADLARLAAETNCRDVRVLDVSRISGVCDFFVLASGTSGRQLNGVAREMEEAGDGRDYPLLHASGRGGEAWIALDFVDVVVHLFAPDARAYYDLDGLWGDAAEVDWRDDR